MKIKDAINQVDSLVRNSLDRKQKIQWLSEADGLIHHRILMNYNGNDDAFAGYTEEDTEKELLVLAPHDRLYLYWLEAQISHFIGESDRYTNAYILFNNAVSTFADWYHRTHMPKNSGTWKF